MNTEQVIPVLQRHIEPIIFCDRRQNLSSKQMPMNVFAISIPPELKLEFNAFLDDSMIGTSKNGRLELTPTHLNENGKLFLFAMENRNGNYGKIMKECGIENFGIKVYDQLFIQLISSHPICENQTKIQVLVESYNVWRQKTEEPFGIISSWAFILN